MADEVIDMLYLLGITKHQVLEKDVQDLAEWVIESRNLPSGFILGKYRDIDLVPQDVTANDIAKEIIDKLSQE